MKVQAIVKVLNAPVKRTDKAGHDYYQQVIVLEAKDGEGVALWAVSLTDEMQQRVREQGIQVGCTVDVNLVFDTFTSASGFVGNKVGINAIGLAGVPAAPPVPSQVGPATDSMAHMQGFNPYERP